MSLPCGSIYDICVVGAGPVGSATALHASAAPGVKVCLVGPTEPKVFKDFIYLKCIPMIVRFF